MFLKVNRTRINFVFDSILKTYATFSDATFEVRFLFSDFYRKFVVDEIVERAEFF